MTKISIVTACYNAKRYLEETILSVITQKGDAYNYFSVLRGEKEKVEEASIEE